MGGTQDHVTENYGLRKAVVVFSEAEAAELGLEIDHDDSHAGEGTQSFALLIHGQQKAGSEASIAQKALRQKGWTGYNHKEKEATVAA
mgnify:CR=1 FL=1